MAARASLCRKKESLLRTPFSSLPSRIIPFQAARAGRLALAIPFTIPKRDGSERPIWAPLPRLKAAQSWILRNLLQKVVPHEAAHGFRGGRSILSNAMPHLRKGVVVNVDLQNFFPTVGYRRVKGLFRALGYSESAATIFALLCTEPEVEEAELDGQRYYVALAERRLPQGAPTSPATRARASHPGGHRCGGQPGWLARGPEAAAPGASGRGCRRGSGCPPGTTPGSGRGPLR